MFRFQILLILVLGFMGQAQATVTKTIFPSRASNAFVKKVGFESYEVRKALGEFDGEDKVMTFSGAENALSYYLGKIRMEFIPSISWKVPGGFLKLGIAIFPVLHVTRNPPKGFHKIK